MEQNNYINAINKELEDCLSRKDYLDSKVVDAMRYSLCAKSKRLRPLIMLEFCELCAGLISEVMPFACAVEMLHTYSLIHDDLPCMDDDDLRRGKLANHKVFGENIALLAGDALLTLAFETVSRETGNVRALHSISVLSENAGVSGMIRGQELDLMNEGKTATADELKDLYSKKTGALICAAAEIGCIMAGATHREREAAIEYAEALGFAFQVMDDVIDVTSNSEIMGKSAGSDVRKNKSTYVSLFGIDESRRIAESFTYRAIKALDGFKGNKKRLTALALSLKDRVY